MQAMGKVKLFRQPVTGIVYGFQIPLQIQLPPQSLYMQIQSTGIPHPVRLPYRFIDPVTVQGNIHVSYEHQQQLELLRRQ